MNEENFTYDQEINLIKENNFYKHHSTERKIKEKEMNKKLFKMFIMVLIIFSTCFIEKCEAQHSVWGYSTWKCSKTSCGYENNNGVEYCGVCGTKRKR